MADALFSICNEQRWPENIVTVTNQVINATDGGLGMCFQSNSADAITHLGWRYGLRALTPPTYIASLQGVTSGGLPDGAIKGGGSPASVTFTPPANTTIDAKWQWYALANSYTPARGEFLASCIEYSSGTIDGTNNSSWGRTLTNLASSSNSGFPCVQVKTGGTWARQTSGLPIFGYRTANGRYGYIWQSGFATNIATSGQRSTMKFNLPSTWGSTFKVAGANMNFRVDSTGAVTFIFGLWNAAGTLLASTTFDVDYFAQQNSNGSGCLLFSDTTLPALSFGTDYYIGFESVSNSSIGLRGSVLAEAADRSAWPNGTNRAFASWNGSAWSPDTTIIPFCSLVFSDFTVAGGGGSIWELATV